MSTLLIIGTAPCVTKDLSKLRGSDKKADRCGINKSAIKRKCDIWYTSHPNLFKLKAKGSPLKKSVSSGDPVVRVAKIPHVYMGGSSALHATYLALNKWGYDKVILCGVPLKGENGKFMYDRFMLAWETVAPSLKGKVFSFSGNTKDLLGEPYEA